MRNVFVFAIISLLLIISGIWFVFPEEVLRSELIDSLSNKDLIAEIKGFKKGLFYELKADELVFKSDSNSIISFKDINSKIRFLSLLLFHINMSVKCQFAGGVVNGNVLIKKDGITGSLFLNEGKIEEIKVLNNTGLKIKGLMNAVINFYTDSTDLGFYVKDAVIEPLILKDAYIPLNLFHKINGRFVKEKDTIKIESLTFEGKNVIARVKGNIVNSSIDCLIEVMPATEDVNRQLIVYGLDRYKVAPGYYVIPVSEIFK